MAQNKLHRKHFLYSAGAGLLAAFGLKRSLSPNSKGSERVLRNEQFSSIVRKEPRAVPAEKGNPLA